MKQPFIYAYRKLLSLLIVVVLVFHSIPIQAAGPSDSLLDKSPHLGESSEASLGESRTSNQVLSLGHSPQMQLQSVILGKLTYLGTPDPNGVVKYIGTDTSKEGLNLPTTLRAGGYLESNPPEKYSYFSVQIADWVCENYNPDVPGVYYFMPVLEPGWTYEASVMNWYEKYEVTLAEPTHWHHPTIHAESYTQKNEDTQTLTISSEAELGLFALELWEKWVKEENPSFWVDLEVTDYSGWTVELAADLDMGDHLWYPVNMSDITFDGKGHTIKNLTITDYMKPRYDSELFAGMFASMDRCIVRDLTFVNPSLVLEAEEDMYADNIFVGTVAGRTYGAQIRNVIVKNPTIFSSFDTYGHFVGGIVGHASPSYEPYTVEPDGNELTMTIINGVEVEGGTIHCSFGIGSNEEWGDFPVSLGGIAGINFDSNITSAKVSPTTKLVLDNQNEIQPSSVYVGGITGYTSVTNDLWGSCLLNTLAMATFEISDQVQPTEEFFVGGLCGKVLNDSVVNNLYIGENYVDDESQYYGMFGMVENEELDPDGSSYRVECNYSYPDVTTAYTTKLPKDKAVGGEYRNVYQALNDVTSGTGGMWKAAAVTDEHTGYGPEVALSRYKVWEVDSETKMPRHGRWYVPDETAPTLSNGSVTRTSHTAATVDFTSSEDGNGYYLVQPQGESAPLQPTDSLANWTFLGFADQGENSNLSVTLTSGAKDIYLIVVDGAGNISTPHKVSVDGYIQIIEEVVIQLVPTPVTGEEPSPFCLPLKPLQFSKWLVTWSPEATLFQGKTAYTVQIVLTAASDHSFQDPLTTATINGKPATVLDHTPTQVTLAYAFDETDAATVTGIEVVQQPTTLSYETGDSLDLSGLMVKLRYNDKTTKDVAVADFIEYGISAVPANGTTLSTSVTNTPVTLSCQGSTAVTNNLTVAKKNINDTILFSNGTATYDGTPQTHEAATYLGSGLNFTYTYQGTTTGGKTYGPTNTAPQAAGTYHVKAAYSDTEFFGTKTVNFTIHKADPEYTLPEPTATYGDTLGEVSLGSGFAWEDSDTTLVGAAGPQEHTATFTPADTDNYNILEHLVVTITVNPKIATFTISDISDKTYTGAAFEPAVTIKDGETLLTQEKDYTISYENNTNAGIGSVVLTGVGNYKGSTGSKDFVIHKADPEYTLPEPTATFGDTLGEVSLDPGFAWEEPDTTLVGAVGQQEHTVTFTPQDTDNYNILENLILALTITPKATTLTVSDIPDQTYTGTAFEPIVTVKDGESLLAQEQDYTVVYKNNTNAGTGSVILTGIGNYEGSTGSKDFIIDKAEYTGSKEASASVRAERTTLNATLSLPDIPEGGAYSSTGTVDGSALLSRHRVSDNTLTYSTTSQPISTQTILLLPVTGANNYKDYQVAVTIDTRALTDKEKLTEELDELVFAEIQRANEAENKITGALILPSQGSVHRSSIIWSSAPQGYIRSDGTVTRPSYGQGDKKVVLTATLTNGTAKGEKVFYLTIKEEPQKAPEKGSVTGRVTSGDQPLSNIQVVVLQGGTYGKEIGKTTTNEKGRYVFNNLPFGTYNLVFRVDDTVVTKSITIRNAAEVIQDASIPQGVQNTIVEVKGDAPATSAVNLEDMFTAADLEAANSGKVTITLRVEQVAEPTDARVVKKNLGQQKLGVYLDMKLLRTIEGTDHDVSNELIQPPKGEKLTVVIDLPADLQGYEDYSILNVHNGAAEILPAEYDNLLQTLTFETDRFSTYAILYTDHASPNKAPGSSASSSKGRSSFADIRPMMTSWFTHWINVPEAKSMAQVSQENKLTYSRSRRSSITGIRKDALLTLSDFCYEHDTLADDMVQVRLYVERPSSATKDILVSGFVQGNTVDRVKTLFAKEFSNKISVISLDQQGDFGMEVQLAAKVDLSGMDPSNLYFYSYDDQTNKCTLLKTNHWIDSNGYLRFSTTRAGHIIVSEGKLIAK